MNNLSGIADNISKAKNLPENLDKYGHGLSSMYNGLAYIKLSMNYYTIVDMIGEASIQDETFLELFQEYNEILDMLIKDECDDADVIVRIDALRNKLISIMEVVTICVDRLRIYEHILNRIEFKFDDKPFDEKYYNTYLTNNLMHYILSDKDNVVINGKISEMVGQLPVRITKAKFADYLRDAFSLYHGAGKRTIDDFKYALSTSGILVDNPLLSQYFTEVSDIVDTLDNADYVDIDEAEYKRLAGALEIAIGKMTMIADDFVLLASVINDTYSVALSNAGSLDSVLEISNAKDIISRCKSCLIDNGCKGLEDIAEEFVLFEGKQEKIAEVISQSDFAVDFAVANFENELDDISMKTVFDNLKKIALLQSGSDFVDLSVDLSTDEVPDNSYADEVCEDLVKKFDVFFASTTRPVKRAVMATVLSQLPVFFNTTEEIQNYINNSLMQCSDEAEKKAVVAIIKMILDNA